MSIILAAENAVSVPPLYAGLALAFALALSAALGVFYPRRIQGPQRLSADEPVSNLVAILGFGLMGFAASVLGFNFVTRAMNGAGPGVQPTSAQAVVFQGIFNLLVFSAILAATALIRPEGAKRLGLGLNRLPRAVIGAAICLLVVLPFTYYVMAWTELLFKHFGWTIQEHDLLKILGSLPQVWLRWAIVITAVVLAPLAEETFFRGILQTILRYALGSPWLAVFITGACFGMVHDKFERLPIFFLGICLGYIYERTGNLWTCIIVHAGFNLVSIVIFWHYLMHGG